MKIARDGYLKELLDRQQNGMIKVITGMPQSGKSYLLFNLFYEHLIKNDVPEDHILKLSLNDDSELTLRKPTSMLSWLENQIKDSGQYYLVIDNIQLLENFPQVLNSCQHIQNLDIYIAGSDLYYLIANIHSEYRGRWEVIHIYPLSFAEYLPACNMPERTALEEYLRYGGLPHILSCKSTEKKRLFLKELLRKIYRQDTTGFNRVLRFDELEKIIEFYASTAGSFLSMRGLENRLKEKDERAVSINTIRAYSLSLQSIFLIDMVTRFDVKKRKHIASPVKFYFEDTGIRNACLKFQNFDKRQLMENAIYNELCRRKLSVDTGIITTYKTNPDGCQVRNNLTVDFVANLGDRRYYVQSVPQIYDCSEFEAKKHALSKIRDGFRKIIVTYDDVSPYYNEDGFLIIGLANFLKNSNSLDL